MPVEGEQVPGHDVKGRVGMARGLDAGPGCWTDPERGQGLPEMGQEQTGEGLKDGAAWTAPGKGEAPSQVELQCLEGPGSSQAVPRGVPAAGPSGWRWPLLECD